MDIGQFDFQLPYHLIAQYPKEDRSSSRLLIFSRSDLSIKHDFFKNLGNYLKPGDVLVLNNTKVIPAKIEAEKLTGGKIEILLTEKRDKSKVACLVKKAGKKKRIEAKIGELKVVLIKENGTWLLDLGEYEGKLDRILAYGKPPLPPYIKRKVEESDFERYQTVYAKVEGSIAAPTAGFHFTHDLLKNLETMGVEVLFITLHLGIGTFLPVRSKNVEDHKMHSEYFSVEKETYERIEKAKKENRRIIACGTSTVRTLETVFSSEKRVLSGYTDLFIYPGYRFSVVDGLITNFHLPRSTPLLLVSAFAGIENVFRCYREAIEKEYRFYTYGDAMLIL